MIKSTLKDILDSYWYDKQYLAEKTKEVQSIQNITSKSYSLSVFDSTKNYEESIIRDLINKKKYIENLIQNLPQPYRTIFYLRYITSLNFDQIADRINYSTKRVYQLHSEGFNKLLQIYSDYENNRECE